MIVNTNKIRYCPFYFFFRFWGTHSTPSHGRLAVYSPRGGIHPERKNPRTRERVTTTAAPMRLFKIKIYTNPEKVAAQITTRTTAKAAARFPFIYAPLCGSVGCALGCAIPTPYSKRKSPTRGKYSAQKSRPRRAALCQLFIFSNSAKIANGKIKIASNIIFSPPLYYSKTLVCCRGTVCGENIGLFFL